jgi:hypothetical protein
MEIRLEDVCVWHINPGNDECRNCKIDEHNYDCPKYLGRMQSIKRFEPEMVPPSTYSPVGNIV